MALLQEYATRASESWPDSPAVVFNGETVTYGELDRSSSQLARLLRDAGCRRGDRVCFLIPKSPMAIVAMLAILKADCMHVPLDVSSPAARITKILQSCRPALLLACGSVRSLVNALSQSGILANIPIGWLGATGGEIPCRFHESDISAYSATPLEYTNGSESPSHILFTSGSTGVPKGVVITHGNVIHFVEWAIRHFGMTAADRVSGHSPLQFDLSQFDIFGAFAAGAVLYVVPTEVNLLPNKAAEFIRSARLTQWFSVPSILNYMAKFDVIRHGDFPDLKRVLWCGENLPTPVLLHWMDRLPHVAFTNLYGPTETTIASSYYTVPSRPVDEHTLIPIGSACEGEELLVLDDELRRLPAGEIGNLYIGGVGLSPGYWEDEEKTKQVFLCNPERQSGKDRIYKTGDLAKVGDDGLVYFVGRADTQIKCRGYRIELGEIEAAMSTLEFIQECAVVAIPSRGFEGTTICCAYVSGNGAIAAATMGARLGALLPSYMLPSLWLALDALPKNSNGKIDRPKLRAKFEAMAAPRPSEAALAA